MTEQIQKNTGDIESTQDEIDLISIFKTLWQGRKMIFFITSFGAILSVTIALLLTNIYRSETILQPRNADEGGLSQYAGLASMAGISLPSAGGDSSIEVMEIIKSRSFVKHLISFENVLPSLMAAETYNESTKELTFNPELYNSEKKQWLKGPSANKPKPTYIDAHTNYIRKLKVEQSIKTGLVTITFEHISPVFAQEFLALIVSEANNLKRQKDIVSSEKAISYLNEELANTPLAAIKESINQLIEDQLQKMMMAKVHEEYSLVVIEPPFIPEVRFFPVRSLISIIGTLIAGVIAVIFVLMRESTLRKETITQS